MGDEYGNYDEGVVDGGDGRGVGDNINQGGGYGSSDGSNYDSDGDNFHGDGDLVIQEGTIFVAGMDPSTTEEDIYNQFCAIGIIKIDDETMKPKIFLYRNEETGISKGEATVTYYDGTAAHTAIAWFDGREFNGCTVSVSLVPHHTNCDIDGGGGGDGGIFNKSALDFPRQ